MADKRLDTQLVNAGRSERCTLGAVNNVIQRTSSLAFDSVETKKHTTRNRVNGELLYGRHGTLTHFSLQQAICGLEGDTGCVLSSCGTAAIANSILAFVEQDGHVLTISTAYEPSQGSCNKILSKLSVTTSWFDPLVDADVVNHLQPNTEIVFLEPPGFITVEVHDVPAIVAAVRSVVPGAIIIIDNAWVAGVLFKALDFGVDVSIQAATKYLVGHSGAMVDTAVYSTRCQEQLRENAYLMGQMADADTAYITNRGLHTLGIRLCQHRESSPKVAEWLAEHPQVARVNHPALSGSKGYEFWKRGFAGSSGLFSFVFRKELNDEELANYPDNFSSFSMTCSWGGYKPLILANQPEYVAAIRPQGKVDFSRTLIRLHIGLEDVDDLIVDLDAGST